MEQLARSRAQEYLRSYVRRGVVERPRCVECGAAARAEWPRGYGDPLDVEWECCG